MPFALKPNQIAPVKFLTNKKRGMVVMRPGSGKTAVAIGTARILMNSGRVSTTLILTHKRGVEAYRKLDGGLPTVYIDHPSQLASLREEVEADPNRVFVVSTGLFIRWKDEFKAPKGGRSNLDTDDPLGGSGGPEDPLSGFQDDKGDTKDTDTTTNTTTTTMDTEDDATFDRSILYSLARRAGLVIVDEIHNYRVWKAAVSQYLAILLRSHPGRVLAMTATPFYSRLEDVFSLFSYLDPSILGSYAQFSSSYFIVKERQSKAFRWVVTPQGRRRVLQPMTFKEIVGYKDQDLLRQVIDPFLYLDAGTEFEILFHNQTYALDDEPGYLSIVRGEGLSTCTKVKVAGPNSTYLLTFAKNETVHLPLLGVEMDATDLKPGHEILHGGKTVHVLEAGGELAEGDIITRLQKLVAFLSTTEAKYQSLLSSILAIKEGHGALVYCQYLDSIDHLEERLSLDLRGRPVHKIVGGEQDMSGRLSGLEPDAIVLISKVALQSLDFYYDTIFVYEPITNPGGFEQLIGRITRLNSVFREVRVHFIVGVGTIEHYYHSRLLYLIDKNVFASGHAPEVISASGFEFTKQTSLSVLKKALLWREAYGGPAKEPAPPRTIKSWK